MAIKIFLIKKLFKNPISSTTKKCKSKNKIFFFAFPKKNLGQNSRNELWGDPFKFVQPTKNKNLCDRKTNFVLNLECVLYRNENFF